VLQTGVILAKIVSAPLPPVPLNRSGSSSFLFHRLDFRSLVIRRVHPFSFTNRVAPPHSTIPRSQKTFPTPPSSHEHPKIGRTKASQPRTMRRHSMAIPPSRTAPTDHTPTITRRGSVSLPPQACFPANHPLMQVSTLYSSHLSRCLTFLVAASERGSPISPYLPPSSSVDYQAASQSLPKAAHTQRKHRHPSLGETRDIKVEKSIEPLGIQIESGFRGGIFVSSVSEHSLAARSGISVGDQLLEVR
jgi:hypothetical protein